MRNESSATFLLVMNENNKKEIEYKIPQTSKKAILFAQLDSVLSLEIL